jgi:hypothetical protein
MSQIADILREIATQHGMPGKETIPVRDSSWQSWQYGVASNWSTLYRSGGYSEQPAWWWRDMQWFDTWDYFYSLEREYDNIQQQLAKGS